MTATVVVSCYNQVKYIKECLDSVLNQKADFSYNIIVADDLSTDGTRDILKQYADQYPDKIKLILRNKNVGAAANYMEVHNAADGDIVFHLDGDDVMLPGKLSKQLEVFEKYPDVNFCTHRADYFTDDHTVIGTTGRIESQESVFFDAKDMANWGTISVHSSYTYRRSSRRTRSINREFMEWYFTMDSLLPSGKGVFLNEVLLNYRFNQTGSSYLSTNKGRKKAYRIYFDDIYHYFQSYPELRKYLYANAFVSAAAMLLNNRSFNLKLLGFLLKNTLLARPSLIVKSYGVRKQVAPFIKRS